MSLQITAPTQGATYYGVSLTQTAFSALVRVRIDGTSTLTRAMMGVYTSTGASHSIDVSADGSLYTLVQDYGAASIAMQGAGQSQPAGSWYDIAIVGDTGPVLRAYVRGMSDSVSREYSLSNPAGGTIATVYLGAAFNGFSALASYSNIKVWARALTKAQIEAEMVSQAVANATNLSAYNDLIGADLSAVLTSNTGTGGFAALVTTDSGGGSFANPIRSTSEPSWTAADFVVSAVSSPIALPNESPAVTSGIRVVQSSIETSRGETPSRAATLPAPAYGNVAVAIMGGWTESPTAVTLFDSLGLAWTQRISGQYTPGGSGPHVVMWTAPIDRGQGDLVVTPQVAGVAPPWVSLSLLEVAGADANNLIDGAPVFATGSSTAPTTNHGVTTSAPDLMIAALTYGSSLCSLSAWGGSYSEVRTKNGESALSVSSRNVSVTGDYDPSATLTVANPWAMAAMAMRELNASAPVITTTSIAQQPGATSGAIQLTATGVGPITWTQSGAPSLASFTPGGYLSWPASLPSGDYVITVTAANSAGTSAPVVLTLSLAAVVAPPVPEPVAPTTTTIENNTVVPPRVPISSADGLVSREWWRMFAKIVQDLKAALARAPQELASKLLSADAAVVYTADTQTVVSAIVVQAPASGAVSGSVWVVAAGGLPSGGVQFDFSAPAGTRVIVPAAGQVLEAGGSLWAVGAGATLTFTGSVQA